MDATQLTTIGKRYRKLYNKYVIEELHVGYRKYMSVENLCYTEMILLIKTYSYVPM